MALVNTDTRFFKEHINNNGEVNRQEIQAAIAKAVELRALHAALIQANSPNNNNNINNNDICSNYGNNLRFLSASSPANSLPVSHFSAHDYPVFTPSYEDEPPLSGYHENSTRTRTLSEIWDEYGLGNNHNNNNNNIDQTVLSDYNQNDKKCFSTTHSHICPAEEEEDQKSMSSSCVNPMMTMTINDTAMTSSCNRCRPATINRVPGFSNIVVPLTDSHSSVQSQQKPRGNVISRLFPNLKKKKKNKHIDEICSPIRTESEEVFGFGMSFEALKRELAEARESRDSAMTEVSGMRSSFGELKQKLECLETYCEELKRALRQASQSPKKPLNIDNSSNSMPVSEEVMVEGFLQIVSEARLSVKQFCKTLITQIEETDNALMESLDSILRPHKLSLDSKYSKAVLYHLESVINQSLYQNFENSVFRENGAPKHLDPKQDRRAHFGSFVALRNLSWNEVLRKGTKFYSEDFSKFCDQKMGQIIASLSLTRQWSEQLLQAFFVAAKCVWLLHLLAFSFDPPVGILRVEENRSFDGLYMEDMFVERHRSNGQSRVKIMVMPGFYVQHRILRCKVLCRYKSAS